MYLPESFVTNMHALLGSEAGACLSAIQADPVATSLRLNPRKPSSAFSTAAAIAWYGQGRALTERPSFIADPLFHAGAYYVQESSSMFVGHVMRQLRKSTGGPLKVLDLCAAPGGKSTLLLDELEDTDLLVSNEIIRSRVNILEENMVRWGRSNMAVVNNDPAKIGSLGPYFDIMLIDAPCSGEGMFRKDKNAVNEWSGQHVELCRQRQQRILSDALPALKPGGFLIYSTCTFNTQENEDNIRQLVTEHGYQPVQIALQDSWDVEEVSEYEGTALYAYRFYPHKVTGEGFFLACLQKPGPLFKEEGWLKAEKPELLPAKEVEIVTPWVSDAGVFAWLKDHAGIYATGKPHVRDMQYLRGRLNVRLAGLKAGEIMKGRLVPDHQLALSVHLDPGIPRLELDRKQALVYLKKESPETPSVPQGIYLVTYDGLGLGWIKVMPNRVNNYLPVNWRILKDLNDLL